MLSIHHRRAENEYHITSATSFRAKPYDGNVTKRMLSWETPHGITYIATAGTVIVKNDRGEKVAEFYLGKAEPEITIA